MDHSKVSMREHTHFLAQGYVEKLKDKSAENKIGKNMFTCV